MYEFGTALVCCWYGFRMVLEWLDIVLVLRCCSLGIVLVWCWYGFDIVLVCVWNSVGKALVYCFGIRPVWSYFCVWYGVGAVLLKIC